MILFTDLMPPSPDKQHKTLANLYGVPLHCAFHHMVILTQTDTNSERGTWRNTFNLARYTQTPWLQEASGHSQLWLQHVAVIETKSPYNLWTQTSVWCHLNITHFREVRWPTVGKYSSYFYLVILSIAVNKGERRQIPQRRSLALALGNCCNSPSKKHYSGTIVMRFSGMACAGDQIMQPGTTFTGMWFRIHTVHVNTTVYRSLGTLRSRSSTCTGHRLMVCSHLQNTIKYNVKNTAIIKKPHCFL